MAKMSSRSEGTSNAIIKSTIWLCCLQQSKGMKMLTIPYYVSEVFKRYSKLTRRDYMDIGHGTFVKRLSDVGDTLSPGG